MESRACLLKSKSRVCVLIVEETVRNSLLLRIFRYTLQQAKTDRAETGPPTESVSFWSMGGSCVDIRGERGLRRFTVFVFPQRAPPGYRQFIGAGGAPEFVYSICCRSTIVQ